MPASDKKPIDDISQPGTTPAEATSRPIIVSHGPALKDPMVTSDSSDEDESSKPAKEVRPPSNVKKVIKPLAEDSKTAEPKSEKPPEKSTTENENTENPVTDEAVVDAVVDQVADSKKQEQQSKEELEREELVSKLAANKKYFVPIGQAHKRRNHRIMVAVLIVLLLAAASAVLVIDAGLVETDITLPFDLIKQ